MNEYLEITSEEKIYIDPILKKMSNNARRNITVEVLINEWKEFIDEIKKGYYYSIYDYKNDLSSRDLLERILVKSPKSLQDKIHNEIDRYDEKFKQLTKQIEIPLKKFPSNEIWWWWYCIPLKPGEELESDLSEYYN